MSMHADERFVHKRERHKHAGCPRDGWRCAPCAQHCVCGGVELAEAWDDVTCPDCKGWAVDAGLRAASQEPVIVGGGVQHESEAVPEEARRDRGSSIHRGQY